MSPERTLPDNFALIIGAMKSGTTSLFEILAQHPEIGAAQVKEPDFFSDPDVYQNGWDWYRALWHWSTDHRIALEASVSYTKAPIWADVPQRIAAMPAADFRFIYMIRHPVTRISSQVRHSIFEGWGASLDEGIPEDALHFTRYAMQADLYTEAFSREKLLIVTLEEFSSSAREVLQRICEFLDVAPDFEFSSVERRYNKGDLYEVAPFWSRLLQVRTLRSMAERVLPRSTRHAIRDLVAGFGTRAEPMGRHELNDDERAAVLAELGPDLVRLRDHYGVDIERHWGLVVD